MVRPHHQPPTGCGSTEGFIDVIAESFKEVVNRAGLWGSNPLHPTDIHCFSVLSRRHVMAVKRAFSSAGQSRGVSLESWVQVPQGPQQLAIS